MIKINLLGDETVIDHSGRLWAIGYGASLIVLILTCLVLRQSISSEVEELEANKASLDADLARLKETTKEVRDFDQKKKVLEDKLIAIAELKKKKSGPVKMLDDLNVALPERAWLTEVGEKGGSFNLVGVALDHQTIAKFMEALEASNYFDRVDLTESKQVERQGVKVKEFNLKTTINYLGDTRAAKTEQKKEG